MSRQADRVCVTERAVSRDALDAEFCQPASGPVFPSLVTGRVVQNWLEIRAGSANVR